MKRIPWSVIAARIDALSLRERGLIFAAAVVLLVTLPYSIVISPSLAVQKTLLDRIRQDQSQISSVQREMQALYAQQSAAVSAEDTGKLKSLEAQLAEVEQRMAETRSRLVPASEMPHLIRGVLRNSSRVQLVSLSALPGTPLLAAPPADAAKPAAPQSRSTQGTAQPGAVPPAGAPQSVAAPAGAQLYRRGVEIAVRGSYFDLSQFLADLEKLPWRVLWGKLTLVLEHYPTVTLRATVYTLSNDQAAITL